MIPNQDMKINPNYLKLYNELLPWDEEERNSFHFNIGYIKVLPTEQEVDFEGEGSWHVLYDEEHKDERVYGYYRFSTSIAQCPTKELAELLKESLIKSITNEN